MPRRALAQTGQRADERRPRHVVGDEGFGWRQSCQFRGKGFDARRFAEQKTPAGQVDPCDTVRRFSRGDGEQQVVAARVEQRFIRHRARRNDAHDFAFHQPFGQRRIADLFADRDGFAQPDQLGEIAFGGVIWNSRHRDGRTGRCAALCERDVEQSRRLACVVVEQFVKIAHAKKHEHVRVIGFGREILAHQRRVFSERRA